MENDDKLINVLKNGGVAILPSDTVYGIFADATSEECIKRVDDIKHSNKPHLIVVSNMEMLEKYVSEINDLQKKIIDEYWPNTLTILFKKNKLISDELTKGSEYIAIRMPKNDSLIKLINKVGKPLISSSANITSKSVITNVNMLESELKDNVDYIYDGGTLSDVASTIIKVENNKIEFLREGEISVKIKESFSEYC